MANPPGAAPPPTLRRSPTAALPGRGQSGPAAGPARALPPGGPEFEPCRPEAARPAGQALRAPPRPPPPRQRRVSGPANPTDLMVKIVVKLCHRPPALLARLFVLLLAPHRRGNAG